MPTTTRPPTSSMYLHQADAEVLRELAAELGLTQSVGGGARYQAGSLSAFMRFLAHAARTPHRAAMVQFLTTLQTVTTTAEPTET